MANKKEPSAQGQDPTSEQSDLAQARAVTMTSENQFFRQTLPVGLQRASQDDTPDQALWAAIRNRTGAMGFNAYSAFINRVLGAQSTTDPAENAQKSRLEEQAKLYYDPLTRVDAFQLLKAATEAFLLIECGIAVKPPKDELTGSPSKPRRLDDGTVDNFVDGEKIRFGKSITYDDITNRLQQYLGTERLPYLTRIVGQLNLKEPEVDPYAYGILRNRYSCPLLLELIWSYWHEEGLLVQTINAVSWRFQNRRGAGDRDPLAHLELDPLRPLSSLLWGYIQDEYRHLTVPRRAHEYDHHYGLTLQGKAIPKLETADRRSKFLEAFHNLLHLCTTFFKADDDTTMIADAFPLMNALREVHLILAEGAHNQFGDLPWTARVEMLIQKWLLARPEMSQFLRGRFMVPYEEGWMGAVDTMKTLQGWNDVSTTHFLRLANFGEQILLAIRYGDWIEVIDPQQARNWARYWRPEIQGYIHAYRAATGVDLTPDEVSVQGRELRYMQPSVLLSRRQAKDGGRPALPAGSQPALPGESQRALPVAEPALAQPQSFRERRAARQ
jgi:hypothetical protein